MVKLSWKSLLSATVLSISFYSLAWAEGYSETANDRHPGIDPKAWKELYENKNEAGLNEDIPYEERMTLEKAREGRNQEGLTPGGKKIADEDKVPVPVRSSDARRKAVRKERYEEKKKKEELLNNGIVFEEETKKEPEIRGSSRIRREERVKRAEKVKEAEEKKAAEAQGNGYRGK